MAREIKTGQKIYLKDVAKGDVPILVIGLGWDNTQKSGLINKLLKKEYEVDLDLSCVVYDDEDMRMDTVWYAQLTSKDGAIKHSGDDTIGVEGGDDETMAIDLYKLVPEAKTLFFALSSFSGNRLKRVKNCYMNICDGRSGDILIQYNQGGDNSTAKVMLRLKREDDGWSIKALGLGCQGKNIEDIYPIMRREVED